MFKSKWISFTATKCLDENFKKYATDFCAIYFVKQFSIEKDVLSANLKISAMGIYKSYINGLETDDQILNPLCSDYASHIAYNSFDVTNLIKKGKNAIGVIAGCGWGLSGAFAKKLQNKNQLPEICLQLEICCLDGTMQYVFSGKGFRANLGAIRSNDIIKGELIDNRLTVGNFSLPDYNCSHWFDVEIMAEKSVKFLEQKGQGLRYVATVLPEFMGEKEDGVYVFDFKQYIIGSVTAKLKAEPGAVINIRYCDKIDDDGKLKNKNPFKAVSVDTYICSGENQEIFMPLLTLHAFRYIEISIEGKCEVYQITGLACFASGNEKHEIDDKQINDFITYFKSQGMP